ncbi:MAG: type II secretion system F family protein [Verrucomicrobiota bacterium]
MAERYLFYTELAKLINAGFGMDRALKTIGHSPPSFATGKVTRTLQAALASGCGLRNAFAQAEFPFLDLAIIGAGERGGRLVEAFGHLADYHGMLARARKRAVHALIYPVALLHLGVAAGNLPAALMAGERGILRIVAGMLPDLLLLYAVALGIWLAWVFLARRAPHSPALDSALNSIPLLGKTRRALAMARFTKIWHISVLAALPMRETIENSARASRSGSLRAASETLLVTLERGEPLGPAMLTATAFPPAFASGYATAEESGSIDKELARWSRYFETEAETGTKLLADVVPKLIYFAALLYVAWKIVGFYQGYYEGIFQQLEG